VTTLLSPKPLETVRQLWALFSFVCQLRDEQSEWLGVSGNLQGASVHWIETHIADQPDRDEEPLDKGPT